jgi:hypothetical protein
VIDVSVEKDWWEDLDIEERNLLRGMLADLLLQRNWNVVASKGVGWSKEIGKTRAR